MPFDLAPESLLLILQNFSTFLTIIPPTHVPNTICSQQFRRLAFDIYHIFITQMRLNGIQFRHHLLALETQYEHIHWFIHRLFQTQQSGSVYDLPV